MSNRIPILFNHNPNGRVIGHGKMKGGKLTIKFAEPITRAQFFESFGGAGARLGIVPKVAGETSNDDLIISAEIWELSVKRTAMEPAVAEEAPAAADPTQGISAGLAMCFCGHRRGDHDTSGERHSCEHCRCTLFRER